VWSACVSGTGEIDKSFKRTHVVVVVQFQERGTNLFGNLLRLHSVSDAVNLVGVHRRQDVLRHIQQGHLLQLLCFLVEDRPGGLLPRTTLTSNVDIFLISKPVVKADTVPSQTSYRCQEDYDWLYNRNNLI
jgi:hypothetical protein